MPRHSFATFGAIPCSLGHMTEFTWNMFKFSPHFLGVTTWTCCTALAAGFAHHSAKKCHHFHQESTSKHGSHSMAIHRRHTSGACTHPTLIFVGAACKKDCMQDRPKAKPVWRVFTCTRLSTGRVPNTMPKLRLATGSVRASSKIVILVASV